jgi:hypothetical protein
VVYPLKGQVIAWRAKKDPDREPSGLRQRFTFLGILSFKGVCCLDFYPHLTRSQPEIRQIPAGVPEVIALFLVLIRNAQRIKKHRPACL